MSIKFVQIPPSSFPFFIHDVHFTFSLRVLIKRNSKRPTPRHIIIKMAKFKDKERILKATREKQEVTYKGAHIRLAADF